jgi:hypothetical protein
LTEKIGIEVEKAVKEMRVKKTTGDHDVPGGILKLFGEDGQSSDTTDQQYIKLVSEPEISLELQ